MSIDSGHDALMVNPDYRSVPAATEGGSRTRRAIAKADTWYSSSPSLKKFSILFGAIAGIAALGALGVNELSKIDLPEWVKFKVFDADFMDGVSGPTAPEHPTDSTPVTADTTGTGASQDKPAPEKPTTHTKAPEVKKPEVEVKPYTKPEILGPKATFVTDDTYQAGKQTMLHNGYSDELLRKEPTDDDIWNLEGTADARGVELSNEEAAEALKKGGFVKGGVTYEIWQKDTGEFQLVRCDADHELVGKVPNFDSHPVTHEPRDYNAESDKLTTPVHEEPVEEPTQREPRGAWFNGQWVTEEPQYHGEPEVCVQESYDPTEVADVQYLLNRYFPGIADPTFFLSPNPFYPYGGSYGQYMAYEEVQQFILRHR